MFSSLKFLDCKKSGTCVNIYRRCSNLSNVGVNKKQSRDVYIYIGFFSMWSST